MTCILSLLIFYYTDSNPESSSNEPEVNQPSSTSDILEVNKQPSSQPTRNGNSQKENSVKEKDDKESECTCVRDFSLVSKIYNLLLHACACMIFSP